MAMQVDVNKHGALPVYYQIQEQLKRQIVSGQLPPGTRLPSERELSDQIGVSRMTIRRATRALVSAGLCRREAGTGLFVAERKIAINLHELKGFSAFVRRLGRTPHTRVVESRAIAAGPDVACRFDLPEGAPVLKLTRVRSMDHERVAMETAYLSLTRFPGLDGFDLTASLYDILQQRYGLQIERGRTTFSVGLADEEIADRLGISIGQPVLEMRSEAFSVDAPEVPFECVVSVFRADVFEFSAEPKVVAASNRREPSPVPPVPVETR